MSPLKKRIQEVIRKALTEEKEPEHSIGDIVNPIDHSKAVGSEEVTGGPEVISHPSGDVVKISDRETSLDEAHLRTVVRRIIARIESTQ